MSNIRALVLLAGSVRERALSRDLARSPLDLPLRENETVLQAWCRQAASLAAAIGSDGIAVRVLVDRSAKLPSSTCDIPGVRVSAEHDPAELRGTAGVLRDIAEDLDADDVLLVGNAYQLVLAPLADLTRVLVTAGGDVTLMTDEEGAPMGLELIRRAALNVVKPMGFVDFKEQAIPLIAQRYDVRVASYPGMRSAPIRTLEGYIAALRRVHAPVGAETDPLAEDWFRTFAVVEPGATVDPAARVHDSVVLRGAKIGSGAVLVRSLVCEGAVIGPGEVVFDRVVPATGARAREAAE